ncbi:MAG: TIGR02757 family protein [Flavobacteriales bacterium]
MAREKQDNEKAMGLSPKRVPESIRSFLLEKADMYEDTSFIQDDPIAIPHRFSAPIDIEIAGFLTATLAWGNRKSILKSADELMRRLDHDPARFITQASRQELQAASRGFVHRTFNERDAMLFFVALQRLIQQGGSLENYFIAGIQGPRTEGQSPMSAGIQAFQKAFFEASYHEGYAPGRTQKHVARPARGSAAKRINMFIRWMARSSRRGVDFGIWSEVKPSELMIPLDVHTGRVGRKLGLLERKANDWKTVEALTASLRQIDSEDPVRLDFALFGLGAIERF